MDSTLVFGIIALIVILIIFLTFFYFQRLRDENQRSITYVRESDTTSINRIEDDEIADEGLYQISANDMKTLKEEFRKRIAGRSAEDQILYPFTSIGDLANSQKTGFFIGRNRLIELLEDDSRNGIQFCYGLNQDGEVVVMLKGIRLKVLAPAADGTIRTETDTISSLYTVRFSNEDTSPGPGGTPCPPYGNCNP